VLQAFDGLKLDSQEDCAVNWLCDLGNKAGKEAHDMRSFSLKGFFLILAISFLSHAASASETILPRIADSLPQERLARYNDSFRDFREELWEKSDGDNGFFLAQMENFKLADVLLQDGGLAFETKTGCFSSAGVGSKFAFKGDFDIQVDCRVDFMKGADDLDQLAIFSAVDATEGFKEGEREFVNFGLSNERGKPSGLYTASLKKGIFKLSKWKTFDRFRGSFRLIKVGGGLHALYRQEGESGWSAFDHLQFDKDVVAIAFGARNSTLRNRLTLVARSVFKARFGNFYVNGAQEVLGPETFQASLMELASLRIQNSLPEEKLARYQDAFKTFKEDLWAKGGSFFQAQSEGFRLADTRIQDGRMVVETKTGAFSSGGMASKFVFKGDFDVQVDCRVDFTKGAEDMDQIAMLGASDPSQGLKDNESVNVFLNVSKVRGKNAILHAGSFMKGEHKLTRWRGLDRFRGTLRFVKFGRTLYAFYRNEGASTWKNLGAFPFDAPETGIGVGIRNFELRKADPIGAKSPFTASFENFRVNAAQGIAEPEI
jgi:hypothetical protein